MRKDEKVKEFLDWYREIEEKKFYNLDPEFVLGLKDIHTVSNLLKAVGFYDIMKYLVEKKGAFSRPSNKPEWTEKDYKDREREIILMYYHAYEQMIAHEVSGINYNNIVDMSYDKEDGYYDVFMKEKIAEGNSWDTGEFDDYGLDGIPWSDVMTYSVPPANIVFYKPATVAAEIVWELTFYTYDETDFELSDHEKGSDGYNEIMKKKEQISKARADFDSSEEGNEVVRTVYEILNIR